MSAGWERGYETRSEKVARGGPEKGCPDPALPSPTGRPQRGSVKGSCVEWCPSSPRVPLLRSAALRHVVVVAAAYERSLAPPHFVFWFGSCCGGGGGTVGSGGWSGTVWGWVSETRTLCPRTAAGHSALGRGSAESGGYLLVSQERA